MSSTAHVLKKNRGKILIAIAALLIALVAVVGSGAYFTSVSSNPGNVFTAGVLTHSNSAANAAFMTLTDMFPGETRTGSVTLENTGSVDGRLYLRAGRPRRHPGRQRRQPLGGPHRRDHPRGDGRLQPATSIAFVGAVDAGLLAVADGAQSRTTGP